MKKIYALLFLVSSCSSLLAQWIGNAATGGNVVCNAATSEESKLTVSDGANGTIIVFQSADQNTPNAVSNIYAQKINSNGQVQWGTSAVPKPVCVTAKNKFLDNIIPDGSGGVFIAWGDYRNFNDENDSTDIYIQHLSSSGNPLGTLNGVKLNASNNRERYGARLCTDGSNGVIVAWQESTYDSATMLTTYSQVFAQKYNSALASQWTGGGVQVCTATGLRAGASIVADGSAGAIVTFADSRNSTQLPDDIFNNIDIYAQRLNSAGALQWTANGVPVNTQPFSQFTENEFMQTRSTVADGSGGVLILYSDYTGDNDGPNNFYAQRLNSSGARQWASAGVPVCTADSTQSLIKLLSDGAGGMIVFWNDNRAGAFFSYAYFAQRILANGAAGWALNGIKLFDNFSFGSFGGDMVGDGSGNYIYNWTDFMSGSLKAQKINSSGVVQWGATAKDVCTNPDASPFLGQLVPSNAGTVIISWIDSRNAITTDTDIYAAKIAATGDLVDGGASTSFVTVANGNWSANATWQGGVLPAASSDCTVRHNVTVTANASCKSLKVEQPNGRITVNTGINLTVLQ